MQKADYDIAIIGSGLSGLQLALTLNEDSYFEEKKILIIEPSSKEENDKTWCFWEKGNGKWDQLTAFQWKKGAFISDHSQIELDMGEYAYKMIRSIDFYNSSRKSLEENKNIVWLNDHCEDVVEKGGNYLIKCKGKEICTQYVFDSRIDIDVLKNQKHPTVYQHFKGLVIETKEEVFDATSFRMMDFRIPFQKDCCFTYVLPFSANKALVEFTFFSPEIYQDETYDKLLEEYIKTVLRLKEYEVKEIENGIIPMTSYPFHQENKKNYLKIGTAGSWVKASSGYSFKRTEKLIAQVVSNLKDAKPLDSNLFKKRFALYDRLFLSVLENENHLGNQLLQEMYQNNSVQRIFQFLDEESSFAQEFKIINSLTRMPFLRAVLREIL